MNNFYDWKDVLAMQGLREAAVAYAVEQAPEYLEEGPDGTKGPNTGSGRTFLSAEPKLA